MIRRIRVVLGLEAETIAEIVDLASLPDERPVKEVTGVELDARLRGDDFHDTTALRFLDLGDHAEVAGEFIGHPVVVISTGKLELRVIIVDPRPDGGGHAEIKGGPLHRGELARRDQDLINGGELFSMNGHHVTEDVAATLPGEIEVAMMCKIHDGRLVRLGAINKLQLILIGQSVGGCHRKLSGISFLTIFADIGELQRWALFGARWGCIPDNLVKPLQPTMQRLAVVIAREKIGRAIESEFPIGDTVAVAAHKTAEIGALLLVVGQSFKSENHISEFAVAVGNLQRRDDAAVVNDRSRGAFFVGQGVLDDLLSPGCGSERFRSNG